MVNTFLTTVPDYYANATGDGLAAVKGSIMVKWHGEVCATHRKLSWKLMTVTVIMCLAAGCTKLGKKNALKNQLSSINYAQQTQRPQLKPTHPLYIATAHWARKHQKNPKDPSAALNYARNLKALGSREKAFEVLARAYQLNPGHAELASEYGRVALSLGKVRLAGQMLSLASKDKRQQDWKLLSALGTVNAKRGDHKKAQSYYAAALRKKPDATSVYNNLALSYALDGRAGDAESLLKKAISKGHNTPRVRQNLALVLGLQTKFGEARQIALADLSGAKAESDADYLKSMVKRTKVAKASRPASTTKRKTGVITTAALPAAKKTTRKAARQPVKSAAATKSEAVNTRIASKAQPAHRIPVPSGKTGKQTRSVKLASARTMVNTRAGKPAETLPWRQKKPAATKAARVPRLTSPAPTSPAGERPRAGAARWHTTVSQASTEASNFIYPDSE